MTASAAIAVAIAAGISMSIDDEHLVLSAEEQPDEWLLQVLRSRKREIVEHLRTLSTWKAEDWQALFDERAGIMEFDGGLSRLEAEAKAAEELASLRSIAGQNHG